MQLHEDLSGQVDLGTKVARTAFVGMDVAHQPPMGRLDGVGLGARFKPKDLIGLVFAHAARIRRAGAPRSRPLLMVFSPTGKRSVQVRL